MRVVAYGSFVQESQWVARGNRKSNVGNCRGAELRNLTRQEICGFAIFMLAQAPQELYYFDTMQAGVFIPAKNLHEIRQHLQVIVAMAELADNKRLVDLAHAINQELNPHGGSLERLRMRYLSHVRGL